LAEKEKGREGKMPKWLRVAVRFQTLLKTLLTFATQPREIGNKTTALD